MDWLTGLHGRRFMDDQSKRRVEHSKTDVEQYGLMIIDPDGLKLINDTYSRPRGD